jgi:N-acetylglucosamine-6-phosphate deacetylase
LESAVLCFQHASLITPQDVISDGTLIIDQGKMVALGGGGRVTVPLNAQIVDLRGLWVAPGFIDIQINGAFGMDFTESPSALYQVAAGLPQYGVTAFLPTVITSPFTQIDAALEVWRQGPPQDFRGAFPLGLHLEGPMLNPGKKGAHNPAFIQPFSLLAIQDWSPANGVRLVTLAPEAPGALQIIQALRSQGVVVSAGHSLASYEQALQSFRAGVSCGTHLFNAMPALDHRAPGLIAALLTHPGVAASLIVDGIHVHPAVVSLAWKALGPHGLILVTDAMAALGMHPGQYRLGDFDVTVDQDAARLSDGTLAGSLLTLDAAVRNLMAYTGCAYHQAVACCTINPANLLGFEAKGRLAVGADADLVVLTPQGEVMATVVMGRVVFSRFSQLKEES